MNDATALLQRILKGDVDMASADERTRAVQELIRTCSVAAAAATVQPVPLLDMALITPIQIGMVQGIGRIRGYRVDRKSVLEILRTLRASMLTQSAVFAAADLIPILGWFVRVSVAYALTYALGEVADRYFLSGRTTPASELRALFKRVYDEQRQAKTARLKSARGDLDRLKTAKKQGRLSDAEFTAKKEELLRRL